MVCLHINVTANKNYQYTAQIELLTITPPPPPPKKKAQSSRKIYARVQWNFWQWLALFMIKFKETVIKHLKIQT